MFDVLQNLKEEIAILTILMGSLTEIFLISGNAFLLLGQALKGEGTLLAILIVAVVNLTASL